MTQSKFDIIDGRMIPKIEEVQFHSAMISDTMVFWTSDTDSIRILIKFITAIRSLLKRTLLVGIPLRGAISMGLIFSHKREYKTEFLNSTNIIVGKPIVTCYELEKEQLWSGCVIANECIEILQNHPQWGEIDLDIITNLIENRIICKYQVPYKTIKTEKEYVLNWVPADNYPINENQIRKSFLAYNKRVDTKSAQKIIENTVEIT
jgi:hypothetical protein